MEEYIVEINKILDRFRVAMEKGVGIRLTAREVQLLKLTAFGETCYDDFDYHGDIS